MGRRSMERVLCSRNAPQHSRSPVDIHSELTSSHGHVGLQEVRREHQTSEEQLRDMAYVRRRFSQLPSHVPT